MSGEKPSDSNWIEVITPVKIRSIEEPHSFNDICPDTLLENLVDFSSDCPTGAGRKLFEHVVKSVGSNYDRISTVRNLLLGVTSTLNRLRTSTAHHFMNFYPTVEDLKTWLSELDDDEKSLQKVGLSKEGYQILKNLFVG